jgi:hypothetical protein
MTNRIYVYLDEEDLDIIDEIKVLTKAGSRRTVIEQLIHKMAPYYREWWKGPIEKPPSTSISTYKSQEDFTDVSLPDTESSFKPINL